MEGLRGFAVAALVLGRLVTLALGACQSSPQSAESSSRAAAPLPEAAAPLGRAQESLRQAPEPAGRAPEPVGPRPGQGCRQVTLAPPCTLSHFGPSPAGAKPGLDTVSYLVRYKDAQGREVTPYWLDGRREDQAALEKFFKEEKHRVVQCQGGWTSAPCNDTPSFAGFPEPSVGNVTRRGR